MFDVVHALVVQRRFVEDGQVPAEEDARLDDEAARHPSGLPAVVAVSDPAAGAQRGHPPTVGEGPQQGGHGSAERQQRPSGVEEQDVLHHVAGQAVGREPVHG